jgi:putative transposase
MTTDFYIDAVEEAIATHGRPAIFNTDQGSQCTEQTFVEMIRTKHRIALSMDGKGCWSDNVFVERFWRSLKYEEVFLHAYESANSARSRNRQLYLILQYEATALRARRKTPR